MDACLRHPVVYGLAPARCCAEQLSLDIRLMCDSTTPAGVTDSFKCTWFRTFVGGVAYHSTTCVSLCVCVLMYSVYDGSIVCAAGRAVAAGADDGHENPPVLCL